MTQKDKVKELVGRGLNSYHTKTLQQIDRIEKKNKEQNHKISILSNELDNDYLTKTEEGSVVSLEHSKEGMVYLDELQGNTLVNYCTDGSKELTLNGDIDVEGVSVTTTEGVDNGLVDVVCEGNTLVNLSKKIPNKVSVVSGDWKNVSDIKALRTISQGTKLTIIPICDFWDTINGFRYSYVNTDGYEKALTSIVETEKRKLVTVPSLGDLVIFRFYISSNNGVTDGNLQFLILEGDWTDKEIPASYFEGMKSVGQDNENGHKIEILSQNKNLCTVNSYSGVCHNKIEANIPCKKNTVYTLTFKDESDLNQSGNRGITLITHKTKTDKNDHENIYTYAMNEGEKEYTFRKSGFTFNTSDCCYISLTSNNMSSVPNLIIKEIQIEEGSQTSYSPQMLNKKELLLNEPLRGLSNGVKDRFVKIGGKWFIERNRGIREYQEGDLDLTDVITDMTNTEYSLEAPIYEPLEINPELICYNDVTHISNNSIIPCNMKVKNSGYNAIIKPSTLYTIALDTNKSGTIGMNLGGAKGTTINNVLTLTTPATLSDDSLRLYGKDIKGSKVRLLEGDKTNWIPSFFEGMKSCFEDKVQEDGTYKMEILMNNENLIPIPNGYVESSQSKALIENPSRYNELAKNLNGKTVIVSAYVKGENIQPIEGMPTHYGLDVKFKGGGNKFASGSIWLSLAKGILPLSGSFEGRYSATVTFGDETHISGFNGVDLFLRNMTGKLTMNDITITVQNSKQFIPHKFNKIQFSSIEPLRKINNDIKDRFVLKEDNKIYIERNCGEVVFNGNTNWSIWNDFDDFNNRKTILFYTTINGKHTHNCKCDKFYENGSHNTDYEGIKSGGNTNTVWFAIDKIKLNTLDKEGFNTWLRENNVKYCYKLAEPTYEEISFELQKIILEGYENGTLFFDTNIPPTSTVTYAGETPIVKATKLNKTEVLNNTTDINDNIIPYLMDMDYRVVCLELATEEIEGGVSMARLFGGTYEMLQRDIQSNRYSVDEYRHRLDVYLSTNKITEEEYNKLGDMLNE